MNDAVIMFAVAWALTQVASLLMLRLGSRLAGNKYMLRLGARSHRQKLRALERVWPLTKIPAAVQRGDTATCTVILSSLIALKSAGSLILGIAMVFWLPVASLVVPSIVAVHDPNDPQLAAWVQRVGALQVTSHALAAAMGFAIVVTGPLSDTSLGAVVESNAAFVALVCAVSLGFAVAAGKLEASGLVGRGL